MDPALVALAVVAAQELVKALTSDGWEAVKRRAAWFFARGDNERVQRQLEQLEGTRADLLTGGAEAAAVTGRWQGRLEALLDEYPELADELTRLVDELRAASTSAGVSASDHSLLAGGDVHIEASHGGVAGGVIHGSVSTGHPQVPGAA